MVPERRFFSSFSTNADQVLILGLSPFLIGVKLRSVKLNVEKKN